MVVVVDVGAVSDPSPAQPEAVISITASAAADTARRSALVTR
jgi:hypothetical protein